MRGKIEGMKRCENGEDHKIVGVEYDEGWPYYYDGVSEVLCLTCGRRVGRWCGRKLEDGEVEPPFCEGGDHPKAL